MRSHRTAVLSLALLWGAATPAWSTGAAPAACAGCHGDGDSRPESGVPFIAGQSAAYLEAALGAYASGDRRHATAAEHGPGLSEAERQAAVAYYAGLPASWGTADTPSAPAETREAGALVAACAGCHGAEGTSVTPGMPSLAGLSAGYLTKSLADYRDGRRKDPMMAGFVAGLDDTALERIAAHYAARQRTAPPAPASGDPALGAALAGACAGCHGNDGVSTLAGAPDLAAQDPAYLAKATRAYRDGERADPLMAGVVAALGEAEIDHLAAFYGTLAPPPASPSAAATPATGGASAAVAGYDPVALGRQASAACAGCHGSDGNSAAPGMPNLAGLHPEYLRAALGAYRDGSRQDPVMNSLAAPLSDVDIEHLAVFYALQEPRATAHPGNGDGAAGAAAAAACTACHGEAGVSSKGDTPSLAGQDAQYLASAITAYASGARAHAAMQGAVADLDETTVSDIATHLAGLTPTRPEFRLPQAPAVWAEKCDRCHGPGGTGGDPRFPRLAGQDPSYLEGALHAYQDGARTSSMMHAMSYPLSAGEIRALARYYAGR